MKNLLKITYVLFLSLTFFGCSEENIENENLEKNYIYDVNAIYTKESSFKNSKNSKSTDISEVTYVVPTSYNGKNYNFEITTLSDDGKTFNVFFNDNGNSYSVNYLIEDNKLIPLGQPSNRMSKSNDSFGSCVGSHEGAGYALLTGACAAITSFIPFMQPVAFACAAETAVIASVIAADCAING
ncbi:MAG: hypothetical protein HQ499_00850 [Cryomorphaceae bacterium]|nr:hypothetical protein [Cryomorphaceae bacterium]